jgi:hypothetical protein
VFQVGGTAGTMARGLGAAVSRDVGGGHKVAVVVGQVERPAAEQGAGIGGASEKSGSRCPWQPDPAGGVPSGQEVTALKSASLRSGAANWTRLGGWIRFGGPPEPSASVQVQSGG